MTGPAVDPPISAIIPCYNGDRYLAAAIQSVVSQSHPPAEVLVVDDGSTDRTAEVAKGFGGAVHYHRQAHAGSGAARNLGIELAAGDLLAFLDADDLWAEDKLEGQVAALRADPELDIVCGHAEQFVSPDLPAEARARLRVDERPMPSQLPGALLVRRPVFGRVGAYSTRYETATEMDWFMRATEHGVKTLMLPAVVLRRRVHGANHGIVRRDARQDYVRVLKAALDRRRAAP
jgi:glycosyltransferase involved in cell wall biosynthesis